MPQRSHKKRPLIAALKLGALWSTSVLIGVSVGVLGAGVTLKTKIYERDQVIVKRDDEIAQRAAERAKIIDSANEYIGKLSVEIALRDLRIQEAGEAIGKLRERVRDLTGKLFASR